MIPVISDFDLETGESVGSLGLLGLGLAAVATFLVALSAPRPRAVRGIIAS